MSISRGEISLKGVYDKNGQTIDVTEEHFFSDSCIADSIKAVKKAGLIRAPTYLHVQGRANALENDPLWDYWFDTYGERLLIVDKEGINGNKGQLYVVSLQNCGIFSNNPHRIRTAIQEQRLKDGQIPLDQETDVNAFLEAINNDLNTPKALAIVWDLLKTEEFPTSAKAQTLFKFDEVLGLKLKETWQKTKKIPAEVKKLIIDRETARKAKNFKQSDLLRAKIEKQGYLLEDTIDGYKLKKKF